jgi:hypothetical protein
MPADSASQGGLDPGPAPLSPPVEELARLESAEDLEQLALGYLRDLDCSPLFLVDGSRADNRSRQGSINFR